MSKQAGPRKHVPMRTCIGTGKAHPKRDMVRLVYLDGHVKVDPSGKLGGSRGAYLSKSLSAARAAIQRGKLQVEFGAPVEKEDEKAILAWFEQFAEVSQS